MNPAELLKKWEEEIPSGQFRHLFDHLSGTLFFAKDRQGRIMAGNPSFVSRCGYKTEGQIIGLTDHAMFSPRLAEKYRKDDEQVMSRGKPLLGLVELFPNSHGKPDWFITNKLPLFNDAGEVCGVCGTVSSYEAQRSAIQPFMELAPAVDFLKVNFREKLDVVALAKLAGMSVRQFERKFRTAFQMTPRDFMIRMRVIEACHLLVRTHQPITTVALEAGFYDHSDFARQFRSQMGQTASEYRSSQRQEIPSPPLAFA